MRNFKRNISCNVLFQFVFTLALINPTCGVVNLDILSYILYLYMISASNQCLTSCRIYSPLQDDFPVVMVVSVTCSRKLSANPSINTEQMLFCN